ncbi:MAG: Rrf2 family transcriptional regulator [Actinomycetota bacterium]|nr:MAG: Rrf2 family transcriptional regulator [Actinomycetota bacterium]
MKLSTRGRYSTRLMMELALRFGKGPILLKDISKSQDISLKYLGQLIIPLKIAGLIKSTRGSHGGYFLSRSPDKISLSEVVTAVEGPIAFSECVDSPDICYRSKTCVAREVWEKASRQFNETLDSITLADMLKRQEANSG